MNEEERLIKKAQKGEAEAFGLLYDKHIEPIYRFIFLKVSHRADAEDIAQHVFLNAWQNIRNYEPRGFPFSSWLYKIAHNAVIDHYRTKDNRINIDVETIVELANENEFNDRLDKDFEMETIKRAIKRLPAEQQTVIIMKFVEDLSNKEIAVMLGKTEGALRVVQHRALKQLRKYLDESGSNPKTKEA